MGMNAGMTNYQKGPEFSGVTDTWDVVQKELHCCGVQNSTDWTRERSDIFPDGQLPNSCCVGGQVKGCGANPDVDKYDVGCYSLFKAKFHRQHCCCWRSCLGCGWHRVGHCSFRLLPRKEDGLYIPVCLIPGQRLWR